MEAKKAYLCIDLKSYYASVECAARGLNPLTTNLLVADPSRSDQTICLAVSPSLKALGVPSRPRLFEARQAIHLYEARTHRRVDYLIAVPRMAEYERISTDIFGIYLRYVSPRDIHIYSIDECFIDCTPYLGAYRDKANLLGQSPAHVMAMEMIREVLRQTGITATAGIGSNLYLAKVAMDIVAKKAVPDRDGVRVAELTEDSYKQLLWDHTPLTDFWQIGFGTARRLAAGQMRTMGDVAERSLYDEEFFYRSFGINGEILIDHAWGIEPVTMEDIKNYRADSHSLSNGQVLPRPYLYREARLVFSEMIDLTCEDLYRKGLTAQRFSWWVSYDWKSFDACPAYNGKVSFDEYGRLHPRHSRGTTALRSATCSAKTVSEALLRQFDEKTDHRLLYRRMGVAAEDVVAGNICEQTDLFTDPFLREREHRLYGAILDIRKKHGEGTLFLGKNLLNGATRLERNTQIGGHRA